MLCVKVLVTFIVAVATEILFKVKVKTATKDFFSLLINPMIILTINQLVVGQNMLKMLITVSQSDVFRLFLLSN